MSGKYDVLFTPVQVGNMKLKSRFVLSPMEGTCLIEWSTGYKFNEHARDFYLKLAQNNVALMIPGAVPVQTFFFGAWLHDQKKIFNGPLKELAADLHKYNSKLFVQLSAGFGRNMLPIPAVRKVHTNKVLRTLAKPLVDTDHLFIAPSELPNVWDPTITCREITKKEINDIIDGFDKSALLCKQAGIDGVEVHAVHEGYLMDQFTTPYTNHRTDEYGGSLENRMRFAVQVIRRIKEMCGEDYPVSVRYSVESKVRGLNQGAVPGEKFVEVGRTREESPAAARMLEEAGADMLNADNGTYDSWYYAHPPVYMPMACNLEECEYIKQFVNIPVFCAGRMEDPDTSSASIAAGKLDGITIGRQFLCDPEYATKVKEGRLEDIRPCIACHNGCMPIYSFKGMPVNVPGGLNAKTGHCALYPPTLAEKEHELVPAKTKKKVVVIGGGVGGMEAARICAVRGHSVTIYEKTGELGGTFIAASAPSFKEKDKMLIAWYRREIAKLPIEVKLNTEIKPEQMDSFGADEYVIATGGTPVRLSIRGFDGDNVIEAKEYLREVKPIKGENVVIIGGGLTGCEIAYDLALKGKKPAVVEMADDILKVVGLSAANSGLLRELFRYHEIPAYVNAKVSGISENSVSFITPEGEKSIPADTVISAVGYRNGTPLAEKESEHIHFIGDVAKVDNLMGAIAKAYEVCMKI
ncbi:MAG: FAD-dependent oxidoreductase [Oscillospiraceae bacterium]|nr:FAD-dependent oxidoreductase [Oscillospiraceae bacterium]